MELGRSLDVSFAAGATIPVTELAGEDEMMFSVPGDRMEGLVSALKQYDENNLGYTQSNMIMRPDFPQMELYKRLYRRWGLDVMDVKE